MEQKQDTINSLLTADMKAAMKAGEKERLGVLRMLLAEIKNARIAAGQELGREEEEKVLTSYAKKRKESIATYREGGRPDLADKEQREYEITVSYLPKQLSEPELREIITKTISELQAEGMKDFGRVMKAVMAAVGSRADGSAVSALLKEMING